MYLTSTLCRSGLLSFCPLVSTVNAVRQSVRSDCICYFRPHYVTSRSISTPSLLTMRPSLLLRPHYTSLSFVAPRFPLSFYTLTSEYKDKQKINNPVQEWNTQICIQYQNRHIWFSSNCAYHKLSLYNIKN